MKKYFDPFKNYKRLDNGDIFTGKQLNSIMSLANPTVQAMILLSCIETDKQPIDSNSKYGVAQN